MIGKRKSIVRIAYIIINAGNAMELRPVQAECLVDITNYIETTKQGNGIINAPCAFGKSIMIARTAEYLHKKGLRPIIVADRAKLLQQNAAKFNIEEVGIVSSGLGKKDYSAPIVVGGIQTIYNKSELLGAADWLLIDECESYTRIDAETRYGQFVRSYPAARILGFTATPFTTLEGQLPWGIIIHETTYQRGWDEGWLCPLTNKGCDVPDLKIVGVTAGEYNLGQLDSVMNVPDLVLQTGMRTKALVDANNRHKILIFATSVEHAFNIGAVLHGLGAKCDVVHGEQSEEGRVRRYNDFEHGDLQYLINVELLTKGTDFPCIDCIVCCRPTMSLRLWEQLCGRGVRLYPGKKDCLLLDFSGNLKEFGTLGNPTWKWEGSKKVKLNRNAIKICPACEGDVSLGSKVCKHCNYEFLLSAQEIEHNKNPDLITDMSKSKSVEKWYKPTHIIYARHPKKEDKLYDTFRVDYYCGKSTFSEYLCFDHPKGSWARNQANKWAYKRANKIPENIDEALTMRDEWKEPIAIEIRPQKANPKYKEISNYEWE